MPHVQEKLTGKLVRLQKPFCYDHDKYKLYRIVKLPDCARGVYMSYNEPMGTDLASPSSYGTWHNATLFGLISLAVTMINHEVEDPELFFVLSTLSTLDFRDYTGDLIITGCQVDLLGGG